MDVSLNRHLYGSYSFPRQNPAIRFGLFQVVNPLADMRSINPTLMQKVLLHMKNQKIDELRGTDPVTDYTGFIKRGKDGSLQVKVSHTLKLRHGNVNIDVVQAELAPSGDPLEVSYKRSEGPERAFQTETIKILPDIAFQQSNQKKDQFKLQRIREYVDNQTKALNGAMHMIDRMLQFFYASMRTKLLQPGNQSQAVHYPHRKAA